jgi:hypothetical protein
MERELLLRRLRERWGYRDAELLGRLGLDERRGGGGPAPGQLTDAQLDRLLRSDGWMKIMDRKRQVHFFYQNGSGEATWDVPRGSKYWAVFMEENQRMVPVGDRRIKRAKIRYKDAHAYAKAVKATSPRPLTVLRSWTGKDGSSVDKATPLLDMSMTLAKKAKQKVKAAMANLPVAPATLRI